MPLPKFVQLSCCHETALPYLAPLDGMKWTLILTHVVLVPTSTCSLPLVLHVMWPHMMIRTIPANLSIATYATVFTISDGIDVLLVGDEMMYFGSSLLRSLINSNQIRYFCGSDQDYYTRSDKDFGITLQDFFIPFLMKVAITFFKSRAPTMTELENLP